MLEQGNSRHTSGLEGAQRKEWQEEGYDVRISSRPGRDRRKSSMGGWDARLDPDSRTSYASTFAGPEVVEQGKIMRTTEVKIS